MNNTVMEINGLKATLNMPAALKSEVKDGVEKAHALPPYNQREAHVVDEYPACPPNWMHGSNRAASYFVAVEADRGLWLDFNPNHYHANDVAILISIQGINPLTGQKTGEMRL